MEFGVWTKGLARLSVDCLVLGVFEEGELSGEARSVDSACGGRLKRLLERGDFAGRAGDTLLVGDLPGITASRVLLTGLGAKKSFQRKTWRRACQTALAALTRTRIDSCAIALDRPETKQLDDYYLGRQVAELTGAALYRTNDLKSAKKPPPPALKKVLAGPVRKASLAERGLAHGAAVGAASSVQRDLANLPANVCTPVFLAEQARALAKREKNLSVKVLDEAAIRREKMGCLLAVSRGIAPAAALHRARVPGREEGAGTGGAGRQGRDLRHRRHLAQGPAGHGRDEVRHERRGRRDRNPHPRRAAAPQPQRGRTRRRGREHARWHGGEARRHRHERRGADG